VGEERLHLHGHVLGDHLEDVLYYLHYMLVLDRPEEVDVSRTDSVPCVVALAVGRFLAAVPCLGLDSAYCHGVAGSAPYQAASRVVHLEDCRSHFPYRLQALETEVRICQMALSAILLAHDSGSFPFFGDQCNAIREVCRR
jgi:hypothetical protein